MEDIAQWQSRAKLWVQFPNNTKRIKIEIKPNYFHTINK